MTSPTLKDKILRTADMSTHGPIEIDEWDVSLFIRPLSIGERLELQQRLGELTEAERAAGLPEAMIIAATVQDDDGQLIFNPCDKAELAHLAAKNPGILNWLALEIMAHNRIGDKGIELAKKNSRSALNSILPFPSPGRSARACASSAN